MNRKEKIMFIIIMLLLMTVGYLGYYGYNNNDNINHDSTTVKKTSYVFNFSMLDEITTKVGNMFFWIKQNKLDDMNKLDNNIKLCLAQRNSTYDVKTEDDYDAYSKSALELGLKKVIKDSTLVHQQPETGFGTDCFFPYEYDVVNGIYKLIPTGLEGEQPSTVQKVIKIENKDSKYYSFYIKAIYRDSAGKVYIDNSLTNSIAKFEFLNGDPIFNNISTDGKTLESYIDRGNTHKLTFELKDEKLYWTNYELIK